MTDRILLEIPAEPIRLYNKLDLRFSRCLQIKRGARLCVTGDNGAGKSSFLREILLPRFRENLQRVSLCYIPQDPQVSALVLRAGDLLSGGSGKGSFSDQLDQLSRLYATGSSRDLPLVYLQDEPESYESLERANRRLCAGDTALIVSHGEELPDPWRRIHFVAGEGGSVEVCIGEHGP